MLVRDVAVSNVASPVDLRGQRVHAVTGVRVTDHEDIDVTTGSRLCDHTGNVHATSCFQVDLYLHLAHYGILPARAGTSFLQCASRTGQCWTCLGMGVEYR